MSSLGPVQKFDTFRESRVLHLPVASLLPTRSRNLVDPPRLGTVHVRSHRTAAAPFLPLYYSWRRRPAAAAVEADAEAEGVAISTDPATFVVAVPRPSFPLSCLSCSSPLSSLR